MTTEVVVSQLQKIPLIESCVQLGAESVIQIVVILALAIPADLPLIRELEDLVRVAGIELETRAHDVQGRSLFVRVRQEQVVVTADGQAHVRREVQRGVAHLHARRTRPCRRSRK